MCGVYRTTPRFITELNSQAVRIMRANLTGHECEKELVRCLEGDHHLKQSGTASYKRAARALEQAKDEHQHKLNASTHEVLKTKLADKKTGNALACKVLAAPNANPLFAVARSKEGTRGQGKGTITMVPREVDDEVRAAWKKGLRRKCRRRRDPCPGREDSTFRGLVGPSSVKPSEAFVGSGTPRTGFGAVRQWRSRGVGTS